MSSAQRRIVGILLAIVFLDLAVSKRFGKLWQHAFSKQSSGQQGLNG